MSASVSQPDLDRNPFSDMFATHIVALLLLTIVGIAFGIALYWLRRLPEVEYPPALWAVPAAFSGVGAIGIIAALPSLFT